MATDEAPVYEFGNFRLDVRERRLLRDGEAIPLATKVFETLRILLERSGRLVTKDELMRQLWPDTVVEENNLNHNISVLRRALGELPNGKPFMEMVPPVGYRFVADVAQPAPDSSAALPSRRSAPAPALRQEIRFCTSGDGTRMAYSTVGNGFRLAPAATGSVASNTSGTARSGRHWIHAIAQRHRLVRWDERGCGLSDWNVEDFSLEAWVRDQEAVVEAAGLDRFALLGMSRVVQWLRPMWRGIPSESATRLWRLQPVAQTPAGSMSQRGPASSARDSRIGSRRNCGWTCSGWSRRVTPGLFPSAYS